MPSTASSLFRRNRSNSGTPLSGLHACLRDNSTYPKPASFIPGRIQIELKSLTSGIRNRSHAVERDALLARPFQDRCGLHLDCDGARLPQFRLFCDRLRYAIDRTQSGRLTL